MQNMATREVFLSITTKKRFLDDCALEADDFTKYVIKRVAIAGSRDQVLIRGNSELTLRVGVEGLHFDEFRVRHHLETVPLSPSRVLVGSSFRFITLFS